MGKWMRITLMIGLSLVMGSLAQAAEASAHPVIAEPSRFAGVMVIVILGMFLAAAVVGMMVRDMADRELPDTTSHEEPPEASKEHH